MMDCSATTKDPLYNPLLRQRGFDSDAVEQQRSEANEVFDHEWRRLLSKESVEFNCYKHNNKLSKL